MRDAKSSAREPDEPATETESSTSSNADSSGYHGESAADRGVDARPEDAAPFGSLPPK